jgi:hypothetical protein
MNSYVLSGLADKRGELTRSIETKREEIEEAKQAIQHIEAVLELMDPAAVKRSTPPRSGLTRAVLEAVRTSETPLTSRGLAQKIALARGEADALAGGRRFISRVETVLYKQRLRGVLEQVDVGKQAMGWCVAMPRQDVGG